jgi:hypothetical protein
VHITKEFTMRYIVKARPIVAEMPSLWAMLNDGTVQAQEPDGSEIVASMKRAVMNRGRVEWDETCYCSPPLRHERSTVYDRFFADIEIEPMVGSAHLEGERFWDQLRLWNTGKSSRRGDDFAIVARYVPVRIL